MQAFQRQTYRIYPTTDQISYFNQEIGNQRFVWNHFLDQSTKRYEEEKKFIFFNESASQLSDLKKEKEWLKIGNSQSLQQTLKDLDLAVKGSFKSGPNRKGFPKFKKKSNGGSFRVPQHFSVESGKLKLPKIGVIKFVDNGTGTPTEFKSVTILKKSSGKWFASFLLPITLPNKVELTEKSSAVGIDLNSHHFAVTSNGEAVVNPKHIKKKELALKKYQRRYSRCAKQSNNRNKARIKFARVHEKVANQRKDFVEKVTTDIAKNYDIICIEDLNVKAMQKWNGRMIQSAPFSMFREKITWKANKFGKHLVVIGRYEPSSKMCFECGQLHEMPLHIRWMSCDCGNEIHRDHNSSKNILRIGLHQIGREPTESTPPEILRLQKRSNSIQWESVEPKGSVKEEIPKSLAWQ